MSDALVYLSYIGIILLIGLVLTVIANKIKLPNVLLLLLAGIVIKTLSYKGSPLIDFPDVFLTSIGILALVTIVFDSSSRFKLKIYTLNERAQRLNLKEGDTSYGT